MNIVNCLIPIIILFVFLNIGMMFYKLKYVSEDKSYAIAIPIFYYFLSNRNYRIIPKIIIGIVVQLFVLPCDVFMIVAYGIMILVYLFKSLFEWLLIKK